LDVASVEFALHPQHETFCDSEIQTKEELKRKFRKHLGSVVVKNNPNMLTHERQ